MADIFSYIIHGFFLLLEAVILAGIAIRLYKSFFSKTKEASAKIVDKQSVKVSRIGKSSAPRQETVYTVTFLCGTKKLCFNVSEFSYNNYRLNQKGRLFYKGSRLIDFKEE